MNSHRTCRLCGNGRLMEAPWSLRDGDSFDVYDCGHASDGWETALNIPLISFTTDQINETARIIRAHVGGMRILTQLGLIAPPAAALEPTLAAPAVAGPLPGSAWPARNQPPAPGKDHTVKAIRHPSGSLCHADYTPGPVPPVTPQGHAGPRAPVRMCPACGQPGIDWMPPPPNPDALEEAEAFTGWLRAAIEAKQQTAVAACGLIPLDDDLTEHGPGPGVWEVEDNGGPWIREAEGYYREWVATDRGTAPSEYVEPDPAHAAHIAANDPRSVLARCAEDLALLDEHQHRLHLVLDGPSPAETRHTCGFCRGPRFPCRVLARIARPYRYDHPGWRNEWTP
ncbi:hypothetical protein GCM10017673_39010 [Streptosporangium violaceochromogenes]|nr:hypothetical protein GCM10017673_39010 [Streptosporangium violaceochromogenes]